MDIVTHAASGALVALALPRMPATRWAVPLFCLAACLPDLDILLCSSPALFISLHRGFSHSLLFAPVLALVAATLSRPLWRSSTYHNLSLGRLWLLFLGCLLIHLGLDCVTTFGTRIFLPFSEMRVRLNAVFIVDPFLTVPLLALVVWGCFSRRLRRRLGCIGLVWLALYPCVCLGLNHVNSRMLETELAAENRNISHMTMLPDFFTPFYWRAVYVETMPDGCQVVREQSLGGLGRLRGSAASYTHLPEDLALHLAAQSTECRDFLEMMLLPVMRPMSVRNIAAARVALGFLPDRDALPDFNRPVCFPNLDHDGHAAAGLANYECDGLKYFVLTDLRFGSGLALGRELLAMRPRAGRPFRLLVVLDGEDNVLLERMVFSDIRKDTGWKRPVPPEPQTFLNWLVGIN
ncbi:MAG: metal-dependent hydrolase [Desulfovibrionaceae bacterium]|nr:metal-dependent hydrolase [Desulfovibrionaceae bacterium]